MNSSIPTDPPLAPSAQENHSNSPVFIPETTSVDNNYSGFVQVAKSAASLQYSGAKEQLAHHTHAATEQMQLEIVALKRDLGQERSEVFRLRDEVKSISVSNARLEVSRNAIREKSNWRAGITGTGGVLVSVGSGLNGQVAGTVTVIILGIIMLIAGFFLMSSSDKP